MKEKIKLEHILRSKARNIIWQMIATPAGLEHWFAEEVRQEGDRLIFVWGPNDQRTARITAHTPGSRLRFHWLDEEEDTYIEMRLEQDELTRDFILHITDFAEDDEIDEQEFLWNKQLDTLCRKSGM